ncbi:hypothetical protein [Nostoc sp. TCL240-02]|uniref:hypothetical protein n=1 Tax=Nostoc sp. TCL240-02 TaxID=2572090 RepID=UPI00157FA6BF|nr:hypothetical protein [Nostoc sp. TCL240-02]QKQ75623.1 hypothetical protein FBB35_22105 [Nostoc sp. TCL240-02]
MNDRQGRALAKISIPVDADLPTNICSSGVYLPKYYPQDNIFKPLISKQVFLNAFSKVLLKNLNRTIQNYWEDVLASASTSSAVRLIEINDFPAQIKEYFYELRANDKDEDALYKISEAIVEWLTDNPEEYQTRLAVELYGISPTAQRILIAVLSDAEAQINSENLLYVIESFLESTDKLLAQSSAVCLLTCGGLLGRNILQTTLSIKNLPHSELIQGIIELFG